MNASGFNTTVGAGTTDAITGAYTAHTTQSSYAIWTNRRAGAHAVFERIFDKGAMATSIFFNDNTAGLYWFRRVWSGDDGQWSITFPAINTWVHYVITYDEGATTNDPLFYVNGFPVTATQSGGDPTLSPATNTLGITVGNSSAGTAGWDGLLREFAHWDRILTPHEAAMLGANRWSPAWFPVGLKTYLRGAMNADLYGAAPTMTGTRPSSAPSIYYPPWLVEAEAA